jgi:Protein of unknown function (DUF1161)
MSKTTLLVFTLALACTGAYADNCDDIRGQIESKIKAAGVVNFTVNAVESGSAAAGKVVGSCAKGTKKIVYVQGGSSGAPTVASPVPARKPTAAKKSQIDTVITECKDGTVSVGGTCKK